MQIAELSPRGRVEQALKAADLLLQAGGFGLVVVDLGDVPPQSARRVPLTSWFRFRRAVENTPTVLLVMEQEPYARTCASLVLEMQPSAISFQPSAKNAAHLPTHARWLRGTEFNVEVAHARMAQRKPVRSARASFATQAVWA